MNFAINRPELYSADLHEKFFVGWPKKPSFAQTRSHLANVESIFALVDNSVVGLITAFTDRSLFAFIPLIEVLPDFQMRGIGRSLVKEIEKHLGDLYGIDLVCDSNLAPFYRSLDFLEVSGMVKRNPEAL